MMMKYNVNDNDNVKVCTLFLGSGDRILLCVVCSLTDKYVPWFLSLLYVVVGAENVLILHAA